ncbi:MAG: hypothetical protein KME22_08315 [Hassallia sp. WJT32-NPBG1]|jgi:hypothetical protein|nr:hypothetical protein [Hassallia sp. WJT32-NPBG1]
MSEMNGKAIATDTRVLEPITAKELESSTAKQSRKPATRQNKTININLDLDAGSSRAKFVIDGWSGSYPSIFKEVSGDLPSGISGCFSIGNKNYAVGRVTNSLNGEVVEAFKDNKIKFLHIWLIGALANHPDLLADIVDDRKYKGKPARLKVTLRLLSLSSSKRNDIAKILQGTKTFSFEGTVFEMEITNDNYLYPEGYGCALEAMKLIPQGIPEFHVLDLGGGTLTFSSYQVGKKPKAIEQTPASGNGMKAIIESLSIALARVDRGGIQYKKENLESALRNSKLLESGKHSVKYRHGTETLEIGDTVTHALSEWVSEMPIVERLLTKVSQALLNGQPVYATGGGMAISIVADWIVRYCCADITNPQFYIVENPQEINLTGLSNLA